MRLVVILMLALIVASLASALTFLVRDRGKGTRAARALTIRVGLSIALFVLLMVGYATGLFTTRL